MIRRVVYRGNVAPLRSLAATAIGTSYSVRMCSSSSTPSTSAATTSTTTAAPAAATTSTPPPMKTSAPIGERDHFTLPYAAPNTKANPHAPIEVLDVVLHAVSKRYGIPSNANDIRIGTVGAYKALGVVLQQYVQLLEKEGPSSVNAKLAAMGASEKAAAATTPSSIHPAPPTSSLPEGGVVAGKNVSSDDTEAAEKAAAAAAKTANAAAVAEEVRRASFTSLVSLLVRSLFTKHTSPMETTTIAEAIEKQAAINRKKRMQEFSDSLDEGHSSAAEKKAMREKNKHSPKELTPEEAEVYATIDAMNKGVGAKGQAIVERHFPMTSNFRNLLSNIYNMPTHKMVPVLGGSAAGGNKGLGKEFRDFFTGSGRVTLRFGKLTAGLYPNIPTAQLSAATAAASVGKKASALTTAGDKSLFSDKEICTLPELTNVYEIAHPNDYVIKASIRTVRVDGAVIEAAADEPVVYADLPTASGEDGVGATINGAMIVDKSFFDAVETDVNSALATLDKHRPPKKGVAAAKKTAAKPEDEKTAATTEASSTTDAAATTEASTTATTSTVAAADLAKELEAALSTGAGKTANGKGAAKWVDGKSLLKTIELESHPHVSVDVLLQVVVPPRRFVPDFDFYEERIQGAINEGERLSIAKLLALHSATSVTKFGDGIFRMFTGRPLKIQTAGNKTIELLARQVGAGDMVGEAAAGTVTAMDGRSLQKYPFEAKVMTMVYCFKDKEWAIDNIQNLL